MKNIKLTLVATLCGGLVLFAPRANAVPITYSSSDATADFTLGSGTLTLNLFCLIQNPTSAAQEVSGISFDISGLVGSGSLATVNSGNISTISSGGSYTAGSADSLTRWTATHSLSTVTLTTFSGGAPNRLIIGPDSNGDFNPSSGGYNNANPSITGIHQPSVLGSATFVFNIPGLTVGSQINNVLFNFGTQMGESTETGTKINRQSVPDAGSTALLLGAVLSGLGMMVRRIK